MIFGILPSHRNNEMHKYCNTKYNELGENIIRTSHVRRIQRRDIKVHKNHKF